MKAGRLAARWFVAYGILGGLSAVVAAAPPNVVLILIDDLGATDLGCFGSSFYETPNVDKLAATGMRFTAAYAACPVCSPTRASIMTGRYPARVGVTDYIGGTNQPEVWTRNTPLLPARYRRQLPLQEQTIAESLKSMGYATLHTGKWHLGDKGHLPTDQGFDVNVAGTNAGSPKSYFSPYKNAHLKDGPHGEHMPVRLAQETCQFIEKNRERPFFVYLPFYSVHIPLNAPRELVAKYEAKAAKLSVAGPETGQEGDSEVRLVQNHPLYAAVVESMDQAVGIVLDKLRELQLDDNTIVIFTSDNGGLATAEGRPTANVPLRAGKGWLYEGGVRVPTIFRWPGVTKPGSNNPSPITSTDYFPTILEAIGKPLEPQHHADGVSFVNALRGESSEGRAMYWHYPHYGNQGGRPGGAVRAGRWKLIEWYEDNAIELYDLKNDPRETSNVAKQNPQEAELLKSLLAEWRTAVGAKMPTPNPKFDPKQPTGRERKRGRA